MDADHPSTPSSPDMLVPQPSTDSTPADERSFHIRLAVFASVVIVAVIGAFVGYPTWQEYVSQQEAKLELRAYVNVRALGPPALKEGVPPGVRDTILNRGRTPAYNDAIQSFVTVADYPLIKNFERVTCPPDDSQPDKRRWFLGKVPRRETVRETPLTAEEITAIQTAKSALYYHGTVCYRDIFHESHRTDFCMFWKWDAGRVSPSLSCDLGNKAD
ncbi:MAG TPA: hypothetical protein PLZ37_10540 [Nitrospira sp.]|nr:hypothetical protein [Nitrospira sp. NTP1]HQR14990.1 hypothetical protein [Nitrospira sp.]